MIPARICSVTRYGALRSVGVVCNKRVHMVVLDGALPMPCSFHCPHPTPVYPLLLHSN